MKTNRMFLMIAILALSTLHAQTPKEVAPTPGNDGGSEAQPRSEEASSREESSIPAPAAKRVKRVWTNDDFAPVIAKPATEKKAPVAQAVSPAIAPARVQAKQEVTSELLSAARLRQKAYQNHIDEILAKMQNEPSEFRREIYQKFIRDVMTLSESNQNLINQLSESEKGKAGQ